MPFDAFDSPIWRLFVHLFQKSRVAEHNIESEEALEIESYSRGCGERTAAKFPHSSDTTRPCERSSNPSRRSEKRRRTPNSRLQVVVIKKARAQEVPYVQLHTVAKTKTRRWKKSSSGLKVRQKQQTLNSEDGNQTSKSTSEKEVQPSAAFHQKARCTSSWLVPSSTSANMTSPGTPRWSHKTKQKQNARNRENPCWGQPQATERQLDPKRQYISSTIRGSLTFNKRIPVVATRKKRAWQGLPTLRTCRIKALIGHKAWKLHSTI